MSAAGQPTAPTDANRGPASATAFGSRPREGRWVALGRYKGPALAFGLGNGHSVEAALDLTPGAARTSAALGGTRCGVMALVVLLAGLGIRYAIVNPVINYQLDFRAFYVSGKALHVGLNPYDQQTLRDTIHRQLPGKQELVGFAYPPPTLGLMYLVAALPLPAAQVAWAWFQFGLLLGGMLLLFRALEVRFGSPVAVLAAAVFWLSDPVHNLFRWGQFDGIRVGLISLAVFLLSRARPTLAGISIGLAALAKVYPAAYLLVFLLRREWKALLSGCLTIVVLLAISLASLSPQARQQYLTNNQRQLDTLEYVLPPENMSLAGYVHRAFVNSQSAALPSQAWINLGAQFARRITTIGLTALLGGTAIWILRYRREITSVEAIGALVPAVLLGEVIAWPHHCVSMLIPITLIVRLVAQQPRIGPLDWVWVTALLLLFAVCPVHQFKIELPKWLEHLTGPTTTYALVLTWLFMMLRYPAIKRAAGQTSARDAMEPP